MVIDAKGRKHRIHSALFIYFTAIITETNKVNTSIHPPCRATPNICDTNNCSLTALDPIESALKRLLFAHCPKPPPPSPPSPPPPS